VSKLTDKADTPEVTPGRQSLLDSGVRQRIMQDVAKLKDEEVDVQRQIELALERENLDRERSMAGGASVVTDGESTVGVVKSSTALLEDLEEIRLKVDRYNVRQDLADHPDLKAKSEAVIECYRYVTSERYFLFTSTIVIQL
jgi:altered-inheritance-of-mitochondria protein 13